MLGIFLDTETNGLNSKHNRIIEIAYKIIDLLSGDELDSYSTIVAQPESVWEMSNLKSLEVNGFTYEEVKRGKEEKVVAAEIIHSYKKNNIQKDNSVFICQNPSFDRCFFSQLIDSDMQDLLNWPYHWLDFSSMYWALSLKKAANNHEFFPWETGFSKDKIALTQNLPKEASPHRAMNGVKHLILCYKSVVGFPFLNKK
ncbi:MAG: 3'-5' exonuclease [Parachlamydiales bacterium]|jgi:DNA polymerase-3 subunit epsilon/oligoribonuclease